MENKLSLMEHVTKLWELANEKQITSFSFIYENEQYLCYWSYRTNQWSEPVKAPPLLELNKGK